MIKYKYVASGVSVIGVPFIGTCVADDITNAILLYEGIGYVRNIERQNQVSADSENGIKSLYM